MSTVAVIRPVAGSIRARMLYAGETSGNVFRDNVVRGAGADAFGIGLDDVGPISVTLLRGNRALLNGNPLQCVRIACR